MFKGNTKIELTNIHTGKKEIIEKHNTFTNAIPKLLEYYNEGATFPIYYNDSNHPFLPLDTRGLSGIYLYSEQLDERTTQVSELDNIVGYAGSQADTSGSKYMGSLNTNESKKLDNGYKYVWDFGTDRANGTISAVGLTSGISNIVTKPNTFPYSIQSMHIGSYMAIKSWLGQCIDCIEFGQKFMFAVLTTPTTVKFTQIQLTPGIVTLHTTPLYKIIKEETVTIPDLKIILNSSNTNYSTMCFISADTKNKFYYLITPYKYIRFNATTLKYDSSFAIKNMPNIVYSSLYPFAGVIDGYMYCYQYKTTWDMYRWKVDSPENTSKFITMSRAMSLYTIGNYFTDSINMFSPKTKQSYIINNGNATQNFKPVPSSDNTNIMLCSTYQYDFIAYAEKTAKGESTNCMITYYPYFATINNLSSPVVKTADKTMKITYTITEGE